MTVVGVNGFDGVWEGLKGPYNEEKINYKILIVFLSLKTDLAKC